MNAYVVTAAASGCGKTLVTLALCKALVDLGARVQPFKVGPDYIDARFYERVAGRAAHNLDLWLDGEDAVRAHAVATSGDADVTLCEGMMGLFDGANDGSGSTAAVAHAIGARIIAVIDCGAASQTAAAVALGLRDFDPSLAFAGVVLNRIAGDAHEAAVRDAFAKAGIAVLAVVRTDAAYEAADRRLGLDPAAVARRADAVTALATQLCAHADLRRAFALSPAPSAPSSTSTPSAATSATRRVANAGMRQRSSERSHARIAYANDAAFWFTYPETLAALDEAGASLVPFSPLHDEGLPEAIDGVWLGGGYPEEFVAELEGNAALRAELADALASGLPAYAECGGMMYLAETLVTERGRFAMVGALRGETTIAEPRLHIGYRDVRALADTPLDACGDTFRAYEFHYASAQLMEPIAAYAVGASHEGAVRGNIVASFLHRHFLPGSDAIARFVAACAAKVSV